MEMATKADVREILMKLSVLQSEMIALKEKESLLETPEENE